MKKSLFSLLLVIILLFCSCTVKVNDNKAKDNTTKDNTTTQTTDNTTTSEVETTSSKPFYTKSIKTDESDPYSSLIKEMCDEIKESWDKALPEDKQYGFDNYIGLYREIYYYLYDLDKDGIEELLLGTSQKVGIDYEDFSAPRKICITSVYTVKKGKAAKVDIGNWWNFVIIQDRVLYSNGVIVTKWGNKKIPSYSDLAFENGELVIKCYVTHEDSDPNKEFYKVTNFDNLDKTSISKDEYYSLYNKYIGDAKVVNIDWKRIDEYSMK